jgi:anti-sigma factor RsiW
MGHPDDGMIRALLDEEATGEKDAARAHLATCPQCAETAAEQTADLQVLAEALTLLDTDPPIQAARARILEEAHGRQRRVHGIRRYLPRVASFAVLITAGAAAALPGSPVRQWLADGWRSLGRTQDPR